MKKSNQIFCIEGMDGVGKTTAGQHICNSIQALYGSNFRSEFSSIIGEQQESLLFKKQMSEANLTDFQIALGVLYHSNKTLHDIAAIQQRQFTMLDRGRASFYAYQVKACGFAWAEDLLYQAMQDEHKAGIEPNYVYLRCSLERAERQMNSRDKLKDYHDSKNQEFKQNLYEGYEEFFNTPHLVGNSKILTIDVDQLDVDKDRAMNQIWIKFHNFYKDVFLSA